MPVAWSPLAGGRELGEGQAGPWGIWLGALGVGGRKCGPGPSARRPIPRALCTQGATTGRWAGKTASLRNHLLLSEMDRAHAK